LERSLQLNGLQQLVSKEGIAMFSAKFLLTYAVVAAGAWDASIGPDHWQLLFQVACAVVMSLTIFFAILRATEADAADTLDSNTARTRTRRLGSGTTLKA
jgi:hypothetical protein